MPNAASMTMSEPTRSPSVASGFSIEICAPASPRIRAATLPSAPFEPLPATTEIRLDPTGPNLRTMAVATAEPARSISSSFGTV